MQLNDNCGSERARHNHAIIPGYASQLDEILRNALIRSDSVDRNYR